MIYFIPNQSCLKHGSPFLEMDNVITTKFVPCPECTNQEKIDIVDDGGIVVNRLEKTMETWNYISIDDNGFSTICYGLAPVWSLDETF